MLISIISIGLKKSNINYFKLLLSNITQWTDIGMDNASQITSHPEPTQAKSIVRISFPVIGSTCSDTAKNDHNPSEKGKHNLVP